MPDAAPDPHVLRIVALEYEVDACRSLLRHGMQILVDHSTEGDTEPMFACLSPGVEKTLKLTIGLRSMHETGAWPDLKPLGHRIGRLNEQALEVIEKNAKATTQPRALFDGIVALRADPVLHALLLTLERYGRSGRFHNLDQLSAQAPRVAATDQGLAPPRELWEEVVDSVLGTRPALLTRMGSDFEGAFGEIKAHIAHSLKRWIAVMNLAWNTGPLGVLASEIGLFADPPS